MNNKIKHEIIDSMMEIYKNNTDIKIRDIIKFVNSTQFEMSMLLSLEKIYR